MRRQLESEVLDKLWNMGILKKNREQGAGLSSVEREVTVSAFCRRRLGVVMVRMGMVESVKTVGFRTPAQQHTHTEEVLVVDVVKLTVFFFFALIYIGRHVHRTRPCSCRVRGRH